MFDFDKNAQAQWVDKIRREALPQKARGPAEKVLERDELRGNAKQGFTPWTAPPPDDQLLCLDNTLFVGPVMFPKFVPECVVSFFLSARDSC